MSEIKKILLERENQRHVERQQRIDALLSDGDKCFEAEIMLLEKMRERDKLQAEEAHRLRMNQIDRNANLMREEITQRYLDALESSIAANKEAKEVETEVDEVAAMMEGSTNGG